MRWTTKKTQKNIKATWDAPAEVTQRVLVLGLEIFLNVNLVDFNQVQQPHFCKEIFFNYNLIFIYKNVSRKFAWFCEIFGWCWGWILIIVLVSWVLVVVVTVRSIWTYLIPQSVWTLISVCEFFKLTGTGIKIPFTVLYKKMSFVFAKLNPHVIRFLSFLKRFFLASYISTYYRSSFSTKMYRHSMRRVCTQWEKGPMLWTPITVYTVHMGLGRERGRNGYHMLFMGLALMILFFLPNFDPLVPIERTSCAVVLVPGRRMSSAVSILSTSPRNWAASFSRGCWRIPENRMSSTLSKEKEKANL